MAMPLRHLSVPPEVLCVHRGVAVFATYRDNDADEPWLFWYTLDPTFPDNDQDIRDLARALGPACPGDPADADAHAAIACAALDAGLWPNAPAFRPDAPTWAAWTAARDAAAKAGASFFPQCPACGGADLTVTAGTFFASGMPLSAHGFAFLDADQVNTSDEAVTCATCDVLWPLELFTC